jgi:hypothetical protein
MNDRRNALRFSALHLIEDGDRLTVIHMHEFQADDPF